MTDDREPFREAREAGLRARQKRRLENATYTAAEVKVLTEAALRLGRKEAAEEISEAIESRRLKRRSRWRRTQRWSAEVESAWSIAMWDAYKIARQYLRSVSPEAPSGRTDPVGHTEAGSEPQAGSNRLPEGDA